VDRQLVEALGRAKARLDTLDYYPEPVRMEKVRVFVTPWFFRIPGFRRYVGDAAGSRRRLRPGPHAFG